MAMSQQIPKKKNKKDTSNKLPTVSSSSNLQKIVNDQSGENLEVISTSATENQQSSELSALVDSGISEKLQTLQSSSSSSETSIERQQSSQISSETNLSAARIEIFGEIPKSGNSDFLQNIVDSEEGEEDEDENENSNSSDEVKNDFTDSDIERQEGLEAYLRAHPTEANQLRLEAYYRAHPDMRPTTHILAHNLSNNQDVDGIRVDEHNPPNLPSSNIIVTRMVAGTSLPRSQFVHSDDLPPNLDWKTRMEKYPDFFPVVGFPNTDWEEWNKAPGLYPKALMPLVTPYLSASLNRRLAAYTRDPKDRFRIQWQNIVTDDRLFKQERFFPYLEWLRVECRMM
jgi:hypothetical protein